MRNNFLKYVLSLIDKIKSNFSYEKFDSFVENDNLLSSENCEQSNLDNYSDPDFQDFDPFIEVEILVNLKPSIKGVELYDQLEEFRNVNSSLIRIVFEDNFGKKSKILDTHKNYTLVHIFVLLANRSGPMDSEQWLRIVNISRKLANKFNAMIIVPDKQIVIDKAKNLDNLCASLDAQIKFRILSDHDFSREALPEILCDFGFSKFNKIYIFESDRTKIHLSDDSAYSDDKERNIYSLSIVMDIPGSMQDENILSTFFDLSNSIAKKLNAKLVDSNGIILNDDSKELINSQLNILFKKLDDSGFTAGSYRSRRVFR